MCMCVCSDMEGVITIELIDGNHSEDQRHTGNWTIHSHRDPGFLEKMRRKSLYPSEKRMSTLKTENHIILERHESKSRVVRFKIER